MTASLADVNDGFLALARINNSNITASINEVSNEQAYTIYPVPASNQLSVQLNKSTTFSAYTEVYDVNGKNVLSTILEYNNTLSLTDLNNGVYFLKISSKNEPEFTTKFIIQK